MEGDRSLSIGGDLFAADGRVDWSELSDLRGMGWGIEGDAVAGGCLN